MAISVILVSSDSSEESVGTSTGQVILFGTIPTTIPDTTLSMTPPTTDIDTTLIPTISPTIPPSPDYTPALPDYSPASDTKSDPSENPSSDHIPPLLAASSFLSSTNDSSDSDIPDTPPSPTYGTPFTETTLSTKSIPIASVDYSSSDHFASDDSLRDSSSSSSSKTSSDPSLDDLSDSSSDHSLPAPSSGMSYPSRKRRRSPAASVLLSLPIPGASILRLFLKYPSVDPTREGVNEQIDRRLAGALGARDATRNLEPLIEDEGKQGVVNGNGGNGNRRKGNRGNGNGGNGNVGANGNSNGNGGGNGYNFGGFMPAREYTYQDFLKNEVQKMETELWNLAMKGNDLTAYTRRFQELVLLCTRMVPNEEDKVERFVKGLPDNI
ncbi:putative reverse transcriptase domain-containing protein [Tanacetum coccineum]